MFQKVSVFFTFIALCTIEVKAQVCVPDPVYDIALNITILKWEPSTNCPDTHYIVNIHSGGVLEYIFQAENETLNISFLSFCKTYTFYVTAIADHIISQATEYESVIPLPKGTNVTINNFSGSQIDRDVLFQWHVDPDYIYCAQTYRVLLWEENDAVPQQIATNFNGYYVLNVSQCMYFEIEISVHYLSQAHPAAKFNYTVPAKTNHPSLVAFRQNAISINTTWALERYSINKCKVSALHVTGTHVNTTVPILDTPSRPDIEFNLPGLRANSMYFFNVTVENVAGISQPFLIAIQTLPIESELREETDKGGDFFNRF